MKLAGDDAIRSIANRSPAVTVVDSRAAVPPESFEWGFEPSPMDHEARVLEQDTYRMSDSVTKQYIEDYCINRIRRGNINLESYRHVSREPFNMVARRMREIGEEIENRNPEFFAGCSEQLQISETTAYAKFKDLADELFKDQENGQRGTCMSWGRIAAFITFSGRLALHCASNNMETLVPSVIGWTARYIDTKLVMWMNDHQGWDGFAKFFDDDKAREKALSDTVTDIVTSVCQFAVFGAGLAALACLLKR